MKTNLGKLMPHVSSGKLKIGGKGRAKATGTPQSGARIPSGKVSITKK